MAQRGMEVFCTGVRAGSTEVYRLQPSGGVVLGTLFRRARNPEEGTPVDKAVLDSRDSARIVDSSARALTASFWGRYVAFIHNVNLDHKWVLRSPAGGLPCFRTVHEGVQIYFSLLDDCFSLGLSRYSVNWSYIAKHLIVPGHCEETGLNEVTELLPGRCVETDVNRCKEHVYWNPLQIATSDPVEDSVQAAVSVRNTARSCVHAWASCYDRILLSLSGGLDSAIVAACLRGAPSRPDITCVNYYSKGAESDERRYARAAAQHMGLRLVELQRSVDVSFDLLWNVPRTPRPQGYAFRVAQSIVEDPLVHDTGARAIFTGAGGDELFHRGGAKFAASDYLCRYGVRGSVFPVAISAANAQRVTVWSVLGKALYDKWLARRWTPLVDVWKYISLLTSETRHTLQSDEWLEQSTRGGPPGKLMQAFLLSSTYDFFNHMGKHDDPEQVAPLMSEPLMELCLRIPTYVHHSNIQDRAVARKAFADDVPQQILKRYSKGMIEEHIQELLMRNIDFARSLLSDSALVRERIVDRRAIDEALSGQPSDIIKGISEIFSIVEVEAWLRRWNPSALSAAA